MKMLSIAVALTIAVPAVAQTTNPNRAGHSGHAAAPAPKSAGKARDAEHPAGCHMMNGRMMAMKDGKTVPCPDKKSKGKPAADPHAGHDMRKH